MPSTTRISIIYNLIKEFGRHGWCIKSEYLANPTPSILYTSERKNFRIGMRLASLLRKICSGCERRSPREWDCNACQSLTGARSQSKTLRKNSFPITLLRCQCRAFFEFEVVELLAKHAIHVKNFSYL